MSSLLSPTTLLFVAITLLLIVLVLEWFADIRYKLAELLIHLNVVEILIDIIYNTKRSRSLEHLSVFVITLRSSDSRDVPYAVFKFRNT